MIGSRFCERLKPRDIAREGGGIRRPTCTCACTVIFTSNLVDRKTEVLLTRRGRVLRPLSAGWLDFFGRFGRRCAENCLRDRSQFLFPLIGNFSCNQAKIECDASIQSIKYTSSVLFLVRVSYSHTQSFSWFDGFTVDAHVERFSKEVLEPGDGVDGVQLRVDVDRVGRYVVATPLLQTLVFVVAWRPQQRVLGVTQRSLVVHRANRHIEESCRKSGSNYRVNIVFELTNIFYA